MQPQQNQLNIKADDATLKGVYSNAAQVQHTKEEFVIDFMNLFPPQGTLNARVILSPGHMKRLAAVMADNIARYEASFGKVEAADAPGEVGFKTN
jgi:hypothetical protein